MKPINFPKQIIILLLLAFILSLSTSCGKKFVEEEVNKTVSSTTVEEPDPEDSDDPVMKMSLSLKEHGINLNKYELSPDLFTYYIYDCFDGNIDNYLSYLKTNYAMDFEISLLEFNVWTATQYMSERLKELDIYIDDYEINPYNLLIYIDRRFDGDIDEFILAMTEWYENDFDFFLTLFEDAWWDMMQDDYYLAFENYLYAHDINLHDYNVDLWEFEEFIQFYYDGKIDTFLLCLADFYSNDFALFLNTEYYHTDPQFESNIFADAPNDYSSSFYGPFDNTQTPQFESNAFADDSNSSSNSFYGPFDNTQTPQLESNFFADDPRPYSNSFYNDLGDTDLVDSFDPYNARIPYFGNRTYDSFFGQYLHEEYLTDLYKESFRIQSGLRKTD
ncbi:MAG: hypothetical protein CVV02_12755 [Firmicutes bacterium HGW-Firmicutes-7]|nr:MAG: hypothetical protein CVV02_12755 [Firmicutes bacterium HGW-Firmicutes-7]